MRFKALVLAFLTVFSPAILAMDAPIESQEVNVAPNAVDPEDACPVCLKLAKDVPPNEIKITDCCKQFICNPDAQNIFSITNYRIWDKNKIKQHLKSAQEQLRYAGLALTDVQLKQMHKIAKSSIRYKAKGCPHCPRKKLSISSALVKTSLIAKPTISFIDSENNQFELSPELSAALYQCSSLEMHEDQLNTKTKPLDFSDVKSDQKRFLKKDLIIKLAQLIKDPVKETPNMAQNLDFFELAKYLAAPDNILYLIANELWPLMQDQKSQTNSYKKYIRGLAQPHLASPKQLIEYKEFKHKGVHLYFIEGYSNDTQSCKINLSWTHISNQLQNAGWYQDEKHTWYKVYPFCKWDGIQFLWSGDYIHQLDLTDHRLETVSEDLLNMMHSTRDMHINLDHNPIKSIDELFFKRIAKERAVGNNIHISLMNTHLTDKQKEEFTKKWQHATTTFVQKYMSESTYKSLAKGVGYLGSALTIHYLSHKFPRFFEENAGLHTFIFGGVAGYKIGNKQNDDDDAQGYDPRRGLICGAIGAIATPLGFGYLLDRYPKVHTLPAHLLSLPGGAYVTKNIADYAAIKLAKQSHPKISWQADNNVIWNTNYTLKF
ncbi:hypothetical protein BH09DEP1_BH09DEP1_4800 [soil metagenome]